MLRKALPLAFALIPGLALAQITVQYAVPEVAVTVAPPAPRVEVQTARPSPQHTWIGGHWAWRGGAHVWIGGHWALPPQPGYIWEPARWIGPLPNGGYKFVEGHWRWAGTYTAGVVYEPPAAVDYGVVAVAPPADIVEVRAAPPFAGAVWLPGYWHWTGATHVWMAGRWSAPRPGHVWEPHRWVQGPGGWKFAPGHWRRG